jgi:hypothetical protein
MAATKGVRNPFPLPNLDGVCNGQLPNSLLELLIWNLYSTTNTSNILIRVKRQDDKAEGDPQKSGTDNFDVSLQFMHYDKYP